MGVKAHTTVRVSDRDAVGSEMATVFQDQSTIGAPAGVPILDQRRDSNNAIHGFRRRERPQGKLRS